MYRNAILEEAAAIADRWSDASASAKGEACPNHTEAMMDRRLVDLDKLWELFVDHYWDSLQKDRDVILNHINEVLSKV